MKPKLVVAPAARLPLCGALRTVTVDPDPVTTPFQEVLTDAPVRVTFHEVIAEEPAVTVTSPW